ncbi:SAM-dependent methyltransferase [Streptomyces sp. NPDC048473]|uniref:SAM-dependent methyltransferase n=1 Tax=unclassified Streptomyces TaxID=2593676 RepID=UPI0037192257
MTKPVLPEGVGVTALVTTYARAQESRSEEPLFVDPAAEFFIAEATQTHVKEGENLPRLGPARDDGTSALWEDIHGYFANRTPFYDRYLTERVAAGYRQIVILGAGLDTRAFRLALPADVKIYEIDTAPVLDFKEATLSRHGFVCAGTRVPVRADLRDDWSASLRAAGFAPGQPTAWLAEGLIMYFTPTEADGLLSTISVMSAPKSSLAGEFLNRRYRVTDSPVSDTNDHAVAQVFAAADRGGPTEDPEAWLERHGWLGQQRDFVEEVEELGRPLPWLFDSHRPDPLQLWLFTATLT